MEIVIKTDYQDIYRITNGVLLVINKYTCDKNYNKIFCHCAKSKPYHKLTQGLRVLTENYNAYNGIIVPKSTIIDSRPVVICNKSEYEYIIKTSGTYFCGDSSLITGYLNEIKEIINSY